MNRRHLVDATDLLRDMPEVGQFFVRIAELDGENVRLCIRAAIALRRAVAADDYPQVSALYAEFKRRRIEPAHGLEGDVELGVSDDEMRSFVARHRAARRAAA
jgi:hypothetical protein